ncbi:MAG TPA: magnesium/cobalt transporter CorA [Flavobacteriaceae bacterium]|nr:magnesium/cobalt transporter CorA [Flavobacteriaceae bacterium]
MKKLYKKKRKVGLAPGTVIYTGTKENKELFIETFIYNNTSFEEHKISSVEQLKTITNPQSVTWVNVNGLNHTAAIQQMAETFGIHPLIAEDIPNTYQRVKIDTSEKHIFVVFKMLHYDKETTIRKEHVSFILGENYVLSFQEAEGDVFDAIRERIRLAKGKVRSKKADYLLYLLLDAIVDNYYHIIDEIGYKIDLYENEILTKNTENDLTFEIQNLKREILKLRKVVIPTKDILSKIDKEEHNYFLKENLLYYADLEDHLHQVIDSLEVYREMIIGLMEMQFTVVSNRMNEVMKVLTIIATLFIPTTFIAGVYGMNFKYFPELDYKYAYLIFWVIIIAIFIALLIYFKRKKWL